MKRPQIVRIRLTTGRPGSRPSPRPAPLPVTVAVLALGLSAGAFAQTPTPASDLDTLPGYTIARPKSVNDRRDVVGQAARSGPEPGEQAMLWQRRGPDAYDTVLLPGILGLARSDARAFSRRRDPVGYSFLVGPGFSIFRAVLWRDDPSGQRVPVDLAPPPGYTDAQAYAANGDGQVAGEIANPSMLTPNGLSLRHAALWRVEGDGSATVLDLGVPDGYEISTAFDVNEDGDVVGTAQRVEMDGNGALLRRADVVVWRERRTHEGEWESTVLESPPDWNVLQMPSINGRGVVVAQADHRFPGEPLHSAALRWSPVKTRSHGDHCAGPERGYGAAEPLPLPPGYTDAFATDVNDRGQVLGKVLVRSGSLVLFARALVWEDGPKGDPQMRFLATPPDVTDVNPAKLNDCGDAVGSLPSPPGGTGGLLWLASDGGCHPHHHDGDDDDHGHHHDDHGHGGHEKDEGHDHRGH
jgi:hypothetical protein